jgi:diguanylate cyclase (GGDEF)-like protein
LARFLISLGDPGRWKLIGWLTLCLAPLLAHAIWLRQVPYIANSLIYGYLEAVGSVVAFTCAATAMLRFRGTTDRIALLLSMGFLVAGCADTFFALSFHQQWAQGLRGMVPHPTEWLALKTFLAGLLLVALFIEHRLPQPRNPTREVVGALALVLAAAYLTALFFGAASYTGVPIAEVALGSWIPRPGHLIPAGLLVLAVIRCQRRLAEANSLFDRSLSLMAALGAVSHILASLAGSRMDAPLVLAQFLKVTSYAVLLGGALLDHVRLFDQVRHLAASDSLTGLANYRRFADAMQAEFRRSQRTGRSFAILMLDLDGLKRINDTMGHDVGSRAICRTADVLRLHCRSVDTASRFGGDEFALVLPETDYSAATRVAQRIRERLAADPEQPALSVSIGVAVYPRHGHSLESLQRAADQELYSMKRSLRRKRKAARAVTAA